jgi:hypothetical protein
MKAVTASPTPGQTILHCVSRYLISKTYEYLLTLTLTTTTHAHYANITQLNQKIPVAYTWESERQNPNGAPGI